MLPTLEDPRLEPVWHADRVWNGIATSIDGRAFVSFPSADGPGIQAAEILKDGTLRPYPDAAWNIVRDPPSPAEGFVRVNALRIGPDGHLWIIDAGAPGIGKDAVPGGARLIVVDLANDRITATHDLTAGIKPRSYIDDIRFNGRRVYITDAGEPGLLVLDLQGGTLRRVLDGHAAATDRRTMRADGRELRDEQGEPLLVHADQLEVSPDGRWLYFQPSSGPLSRVPTALLDNPTLPAAELAAAVEPFYDSGTTGGTAIDAAGTIYISDTERRRIMAVSLDGTAEVLIEDPRLIWSDAMWIDHAGWLWIPATQQNLTPGFDGGGQSVHYPVWIYRLQLGVRPAANDHV
ncbi:L-dopachrome tautomerase-related protein [Roseomonas gilardii]|uniref:L-dopachrome tautomerase-related protein n=1 Tax=Roseomonas gilardii TaxID=257708 RepID=UPI0011A0D16F|nr:L-dopachrome tautomerase-related protein [Roseomonas gilardii]